MNQQLTHRLRSFDFLRGIAILGVIGVHAAQAFPSGIFLVDQVISRGANGVQLFFFISALTMCYMWKKREGEANPIRNFYIRRFLRIAPLFWLAIPIYLFVNGREPSYWAPEGISVNLILLTATFLHGFWPSSINSVVPGGWSIAVEMTFYVLFPFVIIALKDDRTKYLIAAILAWAFNVFVFQKFAVNFFDSHYLTSSSSIINDYLILNFFNQAPVFLLGAYLYFSLHKNPTKTDLLLVVGWLCAALATRLLLHIVGFGFLCTYIAIGLFALGSIKLNVRFMPIEALGKNSYAIYLVHILILHYLEKTIPRSENLWTLAIGIALTIAISYVVAKVIHQTIERKVQRLANSLTSSA